MTERIMPKSEVTLLRVRQIVDDKSEDSIDFLELLSRDELVDMILCASAFLHGMKTFLSVLGMDGEAIIGNLFKAVKIDD